MRMPLFEDPATRVERIPVDDPRSFAWWTGFRQGRDGQGASFRYDADDDLHARYQDGHRIGRLFRPTVVK